MAIKAIVSTLEGFSEAQRTLYREGTAEEGMDGKFVLDVETADGWALENVQGLKNSLSAARTERDRATARTKAYGEDITPEKVQQMLQELETLRKEGGGDEKNEKRIEAIKAELAEKHMSELRSRDDIIGQRNSEIEELLIRSEAVKALGEHGGNTELLLPHVVGKARVVRKDGGKPSVVILGDDGETPRISMKQGNDSNMGIPELVESMKASETFSAAFKAPSSSGSAGGSTGRTVHPNAQTQQQPGAGKHFTAPDGTQLMPDFSQLLRAERAANEGS